MRCHSAGVPKSKVYEFDDVSVRCWCGGEGLTVLDAGEEDRGESG